MEIHPFVYVLTLIVAAVLGNVLERARRVYRSWDWQLILALLEFITVQLALPLIVSVLGVVFILRYLYDNTWFVVGGCLGIGALIVAAIFKFRIHDLLRAWLMKQKSL